MQFTETEMKELKWALYAATNRVKRVITSMVGENGLLPTQELEDKVTRLDALIERFGPVDESYHI